MMNIERRALAAELGSKGRRFEGYAATFGAEARIRDYIETIAPGAFRDTLAERKDVLALVDHDAGRVLARTRSGTLRLAEDSRGLHFELDLPNTTAANDVLALAERGDLGGMSFAFTTRKGGEHWSGERRELRRPYVLPLTRRLTLDASARVTRIGRAEPQRKEGES